MRLTPIPTPTISGPRNGGGISFAPVLGRGPQGLPGPGSAAWVAGEAVTTGAVRQAPDGSYIKATASRTTRSSFDATEQGFWTSVGSDPTTFDGIKLAASIDEVAAANATDTGTEFGAVMADNYSDLRKMREQWFWSKEPLHHNYDFGDVSTMSVICIGQDTDTDDLWGVNQATNKYATSTDHGATWTDGPSRSSNPTMTAGAGIMDFLSAGPYAVLVNDKGQLFRCAKTSMFSGWSPDIAPTDARAGTGLGIPSGTTGRVHTFATNDITTGTEGQSVWLYGNYNAATLPGPGAGIWRSTNYGSTWTRVLWVSTARHLHAIAFDPDDLNVVYATIGDSVESAVGGGLYKSTDAGATWTKISADRYGISMAFVPAIDQIPPRVMQEGDGVYQAHVFSYDQERNPDNKIDPAVWWEDDWQGSARAICYTPQGNLIYATLSEGGATGTRDGLWIARGPYFDSVRLLTEYTGGTIPAWRRSIISGDYFINGTIRALIPRFRDQAL